MTSIADVLGVYPDLFRVCALDPLLVRRGSADHPLSSQTRRPFCHQLSRCALLADASGTTRVRHEVAPMSVSTTNVVTRPAVSPAVSYRDMRSW